MGRLDQVGTAAVRLDGAEEFDDRPGGQRLPYGLRSFDQEQSNVVAVAAAQQPAGGNDPGRSLRELVGS
jgi:hypothetical protein